jgi:hypothetical protein
VALDILMSRSNDAAKRSKRRCALEEPVHRRLFLSGQFRDLSLINRLADFYRDATFHHEELSILKTELEALQGRFGGETGVLEFLSCFEAAVRDAKNGGLNLYCHAD